MPVDYRKQHTYPFRFSRSLTWQAGVVRAATWSRRLRAALVVVGPRTTRYVELEGRSRAARAEEAAGAVVTLIERLPFYASPARLEVDAPGLHDALLARPELESLEVVRVDAILGVRRGQTIFEGHCLNRQILEVERLAA